MENANKIEERLKNMRKLYEGISEMLDSLPDSVPEKAKEEIKRLVLGDDELKEMLKSADESRLPRILLVGRTGVGKSTLINALCGCCVADADVAESCTDETKPYILRDVDGRELMEVLDTRGIAEFKVMGYETAEVQLNRDILHFEPDVALLVENATVRDNAIDGDIEFIKNMLSFYEKNKGCELPVVAVINKCDMVNPISELEPGAYSTDKKENIESIVRKYERNFKDKGMKFSEVVGVSSNIEWKTANGSPVSVNGIKSMSGDARKKLVIGFDGRYNIDRLRDVIEMSIGDPEAKRGFRMAFEMNEVIARLADKLVNIFSGIAAAIAAASLVPVSDIWILLTLQAIMVTLIIMLSGREATLDTGKEFLFSLGGVAAGGFAFRIFAQQATKLLNFLLPGSGSIVSAAVAASGTKSMGHIAIAYYIKGEDIHQVKKRFKDVKKKFKKEGKKNG